MTIFQTTKALYLAGNKAEAYASFMADPTAIPQSFDAFCSKMDRIILENNSEPVRPR